VIVGYGKKIPNGALPVYSVGDRAEAEELVVMSCPKDYEGRHFARELAIDQTIENLYKFGEHLDLAHEVIKKNGRCRCEKHLKGKKHGHDR